MRIACPSCGTPLTVSERGAGKVVACPKCGQPMKVPDAVADMTQPAEEPIVFAQSPPLPAPVRDEKPPRNRWDDDNESPIERKPKRKKKRPSATRKPPPANVGPWIVLVVLVVVAIGGITGAVLLIKSRSAAEEELRRPEPATESLEPSPPAEKPIRNISYGPLPAGWSYNPPSMGFKAAWPVEPGADKFTPADAFAVTNSGTMPNSWSVVKGSGEDQSLILGVTRIVLPEETVIDSAKTLKNYLSRLQQAAGPNATTKDCTVDGKPGYEIRGEVMGMRFVQRATILDNVIWTVHFKTNLPLNQTDEIANRLFDSFIPFPGD